MKTLATARRVLTQLRHDPRTIALVVVAPCIFVLILRYMLDGSPTIFDRIGSMILGVFPFIMMFVVSSITMLRERRSGTLERLLSLPMPKLSLLGGYGLALAVMTIVQVLAVIILAVGALGLNIHHFGLLLAVAVLSGWLGVAIGLFASAFAKSEFQAVQFMPAFVLPQLLLAGFFVPREAMQSVLQWIANILPLTYVVDAIQAVVGSSIDGGKLALGLIVMVCFIIAALVVGSLTLKRRS